jgi:3-dehydroquinate dehydratase-1
VICVSIMERTKEATLAALCGVEFAEVRLDALPPSAEDAREIFRAHPRLIATMRPGPHPDEQRLTVLAAAIGAGAAYVDIELDSPTILREGVLAEARRHGCEVIVSHHDHERTPGREELVRIVGECFAAGADIAKVACRADSARDAARILGLLDDGRPIVAIGMGRMGRMTRVVAPLLGSPFTYASRGAGAETAEGQLDEGTLRRILREIEDAGG